MSKEQEELAPELERIGRGARRKVIAALDVTGARSIDVSKDLEGLEEEELKPTLKELNRMLGVTTKSRQVDFSWAEGDGHVVLISG